MGAYVQYVRLTNRDGAYVQYVRLTNRDGDVCTICKRDGGLHICISEMGAYM